MKLIWVYWIQGNWASSLVLSIDVQFLVVDNDSICAKESFTNIKHMLEHGIELNAQGRGSWIV